MSEVMDEAAEAFAEAEQPEALGGAQRFKLTDPSTKFYGVFVDGDREVEMLQEGYSVEGVAVLRATVAQFTTEPVWNADMRIWWVDRSQWFRVESAQRSGPHFEFRLRAQKS